MQVFVVKIDGTAGEVLTVFGHVAFVQVAVQVFVAAERHRQDLLVIVVMQLVRLDLTESLFAFSQVASKKLEAAIANQKAVVDVKLDLFDKVETAHTVLILFNQTEELTVVSLAFSDGIDESFSA